MTINQLIFFGSAACVVVAFMLMFFVMWRGHVKWKQKLAYEMAARAALEKRFAVIVDADAEAARIIGDAQTVAETTTLLSEAQAVEREAGSKALVASLTAQVSATSANLSDLRQVPLRTGPPRRNPDFRSDVP